MLHYTNACLIDVNCVLQKSYLLQYLTQSGSSLHKIPRKQNLGQSSETLMGGLNNSRSTISLKTSYLQFILSWRHILAMFQPICSNTAVNFLMEKQKTNWQSHYPQLILAVRSSIINPSFIVFRKHWQLKWNNCVESLVIFSCSTKYQK